MIRLAATGRVADSFDLLVVGNAHVHSTGIVDWQRVACGGSRFDHFADVIYGGSKWSKQLHMGFALFNHTQNWLGVHSARKCPCYHPCWCQGYR
jgi:hypothetical protein